jgi:hypothetical protein
MICDKYRGKNTGPQCVNLELLVGAAMPQFIKLPEKCSESKNLLN